MTCTVHSTYFTVASIPAACLFNVCTRAQIPKDNSVQFVHVTAVYIQYIA